ncbi:hypothetical protein ACLBOM_25905 [Escherichia coli]
MNVIAGACLPDCNPTVRSDEDPGQRSLAPEFAAGEWDISGTYAANDTVPSAAAGAVLSPQPNMVQRFIAAAPPDEPRLMVSTDGVADIPVQGDLDYTNHFGIAVVPLISSCRAFHRGGEH